MTSLRLVPGGAFSRRLWAFSTMTILASTIAPIAMAMPPRLMMLELMPSKCIGINASATAIGSTIIGTSELPKCSKKMMMTSATTMPSSIRAVFERMNRAVDQIAAVIDGLKLNPLGK